MFKRSVFILVLSTFLFTTVKAQTNAETVMILPFENTSNQAEFNWVGESLANSLSELLKVPSLNVISNQERKIIQQRLGVSLTILPSTATSLKMAREGKATLLIAGKYSITPAQGDTAASVNVTSKIIRVNEGRFLSEEVDGKRFTRDINLNDALGNLQTVEGQIAYVILYQLFKSTLAISQNELIEAANKVPARAFEAYIKGLLTPPSEVRENYFKNALRLYAETKEGAVYSAAALELGHYFLNQKKNSEAIEYFSRVPQDDETNYAEAAFYTGLIRWQEKNYEQALAVLRPLAEDLKLTSVYNTLGAIAVEASRDEKKNKGKSDALLNEGIELLKKAAASAPDENSFRFNYGLALFLNKDNKTAADQFRPVLASNSRDGEAYFMLAKSLELQGETEKAAEFDNQARRFLIAGNQYAKLQDEWQKSKTVGNVSLRVAQPSRREFVSVILSNKQATTTVQKSVSETDNLLAQARKLYQEGSNDEAMSVLRRILASKPMSAESYLILGLIHLRQGEIDQATSSLKTALFWDNRLIQANVNLGKIFLQKGDCLQAQNYSRLSLELEPENEEALGLQRQVERCSK
ncbi:MAG: tetratricopeptide repeat protein [Pyrinomonadaceae bacterium]